MPVAPGFWGEGWFAGVAVDDDEALSRRADDRRYRRELPAGEHKYNHMTWVNDLAESLRPPHYASVRNGLAVVAEGSIGWGGLHAFVCMRARAYVFGLAAPSRTNAD